MYRVPVLLSVYFAAVVLSTIVYGLARVLQQFQEQQLRDELRDREAIETRQ